MKTSSLIKITSALAVSINEALGFDLHEALQEALIEKKLLLLGVQSKSCIYCKKMEKEVFESKRVMYKLDKWYVYRKIMIEKDELPDFLEVKYFPTHFVVDPREKKALEEFVGYICPRDFVNYLRIIYKQEENRLRPKIDMM